MTHYKFINDFRNQDFRLLLKQYFDEFDIKISNWDRLFEVINHDHNLAYLLYKDGVAIGFIMFSIERSSHPYITERFGFVKEFYVDKNYQNKGYGSTLLNKCEQYLLDYNVYKVVLTTDTAETFYNKHGYKQAFSYISKNEDPVYFKILNKKTTS